MEQKKITKYFIITVAILIGLLPSYNLYQYLKKYDFTQLHSIDGIEKYVNYFAYKVFNRSLNQDQVIVGKDGFLFLGNKYNNVLHKTNGVFRPPLSEIDEWTNKLKDLQQWYEDRGIKFVIAIAPNKHTIYKEKLPNWMQYHGETITDDIVKYSNEKNINILDLRPYILKAKSENLLYWKTDTHWNQKGAAEAFREIVSYLNTTYQLNITVPQFAFKESTRGGGDLANFLKISSIMGKNFEQEYLYDFKENFDICKGNIDKTNGQLDKCVKINNPIMKINGQPQYMINKSVEQNRLLLLCDSFGSAPSQLYNASFNTIWKWHHGHINGKKLHDFILQNKPNIVIYQIIERSLYNQVIVSQLPKISNIVTDDFSIEKKIFDLEVDKYYKNDDFSILQKGILELDVQKKDPIVILSNTQSYSKTVVLEYEIISPQNTTFQIFYKETPLSKYNELDSYKVAIKQGENKISLLMPSRYINNGLRLDLVSSTGQYSIKSLKIYDQ